ncbi:hypothetical protein HDU98_001225 [Podochytrium sp. JEL0797]|nr:hypothetical protein HDU98_001225 [Podochytrium sp. JEL0797]
METEQSAMIRRLNRELTKSRDAQAEAMAALGNECTENLVKDATIAGLLAENSRLHEQVIKGFAKDATIVGLRNEVVNLENANLELRNRLSEVEDRLRDAVSKIKDVVFTPPSAAESPDLIAEMTEEALWGTPIGEPKGAFPHAPSPSPTTAFKVMEDKILSIGEKMRHSRPAFFTAITSSSTTSKIPTTTTTSSSTTSQVPTTTAASSSSSSSSIPHTTVSADTELIKQFLFNAPATSSSAPVLEMVKGPYQDFDRTTNLIMSQSTGQVLCLTRDLGKVFTLRTSIPTPFKKYTVTDEFRQFYLTVHQKADTAKCKTVHVIDLELKKYLKEEPVESQRRAKEFFDVLDSKQFTDLFSEMCAWEKNFEFAQKK